MKEQYFQIKVLVRLQKVGWIFILAWFAVGTVLYVLELSVARQVAFWGVIALLVMTLLKVFIIAEQFRMARLYRFCLWSYALFFILLSTILLKAFFI